jgi:hypothetical protein
MAAAAAAIVLRDPALLGGDVGFWAEEGSVYFQYAWHHGWRAALWATHQGYFALVPNVATALATGVPLEYAPTVTVLAAASIQFAVVALVAFGRAPLFDWMPARVLGVALVLLVARSDEVWLNTINSQFHLALAAALILIEPARDAGRVRRLALRALLLIAGLTGPGTAALAVPYAVAAWTSRERERAVQAAVLAVCAGVQATVMLGAAGQLGLEGRMAGLDLPSLASIIGVRTMVFPFLGAGIAMDVITVLERAGAHDPAARLGVGLALLMLEAALVAWLAGGSDARERRGLAAAYVLLVAASVLGATGSRPEKAVFISPSFSTRYFYAPAVLLALAALSRTCAAAAGGTPARALAGALPVAAALAVGAGFWTTMPAAGPSWRAQLAAWRADPARPLVIRPRRWRMHLVRHRRPTPDETSAPDRGPAGASRPDSVARDEGRTARFALAGCRDRQRGSSTWYVDARICQPWFTRTRL